MTRISFDTLIAELVSDPDRDVTSRNGVLYVRDQRFAFLDGSALAVLLPVARAEDLVGRGVARPVADGPSTASRWVAVAEPEDWSELAGEAHDFAHGPLPGRES